MLNLGSQGHEIFLGFAWRLPMSDTHELFTQAPGLNIISLNLATPDSKPHARPNASAFHSKSGHIFVGSAPKVNALVGKYCQI